ncbi:MAG: putative Alanyl-tRNA editing protein AlaX-M [Promethearchaeota archaeon]|nr:MAG: putative Alanyl-tRNA editing protein AlaX-M [Candidatus Lokiarchaeota archaeon]
MSKKLYWESPYATSFEGKIIEKREDGIVLDQTLFYPQGGGQECDIGFFEVEEKEIEIQKVTSQIDKIIHQIPIETLPDLKVGQNIIGKINWKHRYALMKAHTAQHLISAILQNNYGIETENAYIEPNKVILHLKKKISYQQLTKTFIQANNYSTLKNLQLNSVITTRDKVKKDFPQLRGDIPNVEKVRITQIEDLDIICCGGTHLKNTTEIGPIFLYEIKTQNELKFRVGKKAINRIVNLNIDALDISNQINIKLNQIKKKIQTVAEEKTSLSQENEELKLKLLNHIFKSPVFRFGKIKIFCLDFSVDYKLIQKKIDNLPEDSILIAFFENKKVRIVSKVPEASANELVQLILSKFKGKGGGSHFNAQAYIPKVPKKFKKSVINIIKNKVSQ